MTDSAEEGEGPRPGPPATPGADTPARSGPPPIGPGVAGRRRLEFAILGTVGRRLLFAVPLLLAASLLTFVLVSLAPGNVVQAILGVNAPAEHYDRLTTQLGLDLPLHQQYWNWLVGALRGDLGTSLFTGESVTTAIGKRLPATLSLMVGALVVSCIVGMALGALSAIKGGKVGRFVDVLALAGFSVPAFWLGAYMILVFAVTLEWFPATGYVPMGRSFGDWLRSLTLPTLALAFGGVAAVAKQTREAMLDSLASDFIRSARANGVAPWSIYLRHGLKNSSIRVMTILGLQAVALLGGTVVIESVFALPGMGLLAASATSRGDLPIIQGIVAYYTVMVIAVNLVIDIMYSVLNPRVRAG